MVQQNTPPCSMTQGMERLCWSANKYGILSNTQLFSHNMSILERCAGSVIAQSFIKGAMYTIALFFGNDLNNLVIQAQPGPFDM
jgi:hypothetical protein